ncbi:SIR2 family NAD-dependent protein deacylase [Aspergillus stella-maris]|uniref:SIR2 family NAD-dependent protein deacylase n=1 Tax=Aspergillus stella-maris TaxID=1810926 RepID=UPI003CCCC3E6
MSLEPSPKTQPQEQQPTSQSTTLDSICNSILTGSIKNITVLAGAGLSTSTGIPDFRSPNTGLYARLAPLQLPYPEAIFHSSYFKHTPEPFYAIARARHPRNLKPTVGHAFLALLEKKGVLRFVFTQNIDGLERDAGVSKERVLNVHGNWERQYCNKCRADYPDNLMRGAIEKGEVPICTLESCGGVVRPGIVMFGESLPKEFDEREQDILPQTDLLIVLGTSLKVAPVSVLPRKVRDSVPRVLINNERTGDVGSRDNDVLMLGSCDDGAREMARKLGWEGELEDLWKGAVARKEEALKKEGWNDDGPSLDECIQKAAEKMQVRMGVSEGHRRMLEGHLGEKLKGIMLGADHLDRGLEPQV